MNDSSTPDHPRAESPGDRIDRYELVSELGAGGMGSVWRATQHEPVRRDVALKIIKLGMDTEEVVRRFDLERQALALMDHPHVAKVFDGGATETGRPYFVMELVEGAPITDYCNAKQLGIDARIDLLRQVCLAVQHAHQKGIIHRDLKPSNVLVAEQDGVAVPKIIDFGIAKATDVEAAQHTMLTQHAQILGTPEYMAPEQADGFGDQDVDTRADVYSLGVLLYELLTGSKPFDAKEVLAAGFQELLRRIREVDPERPSTRVSTHGAGGDDTAIVFADDSGDPTTLSRRLRGDLDWIVMRALEKDRDRRYGSASGFAEDLRRYLDGEPVDAAPPSSGYRLRKFVQRRKKAVAAAAAIAFLFVAGAVGSGLGWWSAIEANASLEVALDEKSQALGVAREARDAAEKSEQRAQDQARIAELARDRAEERLDDLRAVTAFQKERIRDLDPRRMGEVIRKAIRDVLPQAGGSSAAVGTALDGIDFTTVARRSLEQTFFAPTLATIEGDFADQPMVQAHLLQVHADALVASGFAELALDPQERALALRRQHMDLGDAYLLASMLSTATLWMRLQRFDEAEALLREVIEATEALHGPEHRNTLTARNNWANVLQELGRLEEAEAEFDEIVEIRRRAFADDEAYIAEAEQNLAFVHRALGRYAEAREGFDRAIEVLRRVSGDEHQSTIMAIANRGFLFEQIGMPDLARKDLEEGLVGLRRLYGDVHPSTRPIREALLRLGVSASSQVASTDPDEVAAAEVSATSTSAGLSLSELEDTARSKADAGNRIEAVALFRRALDRSVAERGADHEATAALRDDLARVLQQRGDVDAAAELLRESLESRRRLQGPDNPRTLVATTNLGGFFEENKRYAEAEELYVEAYERMVRVFGPDHPHTLTTQGNIGSMMCRRRAFEEALEPLRASVAGKKRVLGADHPQTYATMEPLAWALNATRRWVELEEVTRAIIDHANEVHGPLHPMTITTNQRLGTALARQGRLAEAEPYLRRWADDGTKFLGSRSEYPMTALHELTLVLIGQGKLEKAEARCREQLERRREMAPAGHVYIVGCAANLADVLIDLGRFEEAEPLCEEAAAGAPGGFGPKSEWTLEIVAMLARARRGLDKHGEADAVLQALVDEARAASPVDEAWLADVLTEFGEQLLESGRFDESVAMFEEGLALRDADDAEPSWQIMTLRNALGAARGGRGEFAEAESLVLDAAEWLWNDPSMPAPLEVAGPKDRAEVGAERAAEFLEAWHESEPDGGHDERASQWRARLAERARIKNH